MLGTVNETIGLLKNSILYRCSLCSGSFHASFSLAPSQPTLLMRRTMSDGSYRVQKVIFVRHAVAFHNLPGSDIRSPEMFDPALIPQGKIGAIQAGDRIQRWWRHNHGNAKIDSIIVSPLTRCLQTATLAFLPGDDYFSATPPTFYCCEHIREAFGIHYSDKRRNKSLLQVCDVIFRIREWFSSQRSFL